MLLSLGFYTYTEHLRYNYVLVKWYNLNFLSDWVVGFILATGPALRYKEGHFVVMVVNLCFGLVACFHLAYLGVMFDQQQDAMLEGYSRDHVLAKWRNLDFLSHWVVGFTFLMSLLL